MLKEVSERKPYKTAAFVFGFALLTLIILSRVLAWTNPFASPPGGSPGPLPISIGGTGASSAATARTNLGLGTLSTLNSPLSVLNGGTGTTTLSGLLLGNGTSAFSGLTGTSNGQVPTWNSATSSWISQAPGGGSSWSQFTWVNAVTTDVGGTLYCTFSCPAGQVVWDYKGTIFCPAVGNCFNNIVWASTTWPDYWYATDYLGSASATVGHNSWSCTPQGKFLCGPQ